MEAAASEVSSEPEHLLDDLKSDGGGSSEWSIVLFGGGGGGSDPDATSAIPPNSGVDSPPEKSGAEEEENEEDEAEAAATAAPIRIRHEQKGPMHLGWRSRRKLDRRHVDPLQLRRRLHRVMPLWLTALPAEGAPGGLDGVSIPVSEFSDKEYATFSAAFLQNSVGRIRNQFPSTSAPLVTLTPLPEDVTQRFMARFTALAGEGVRPRLVFHGTKAANLQSIQDRGLLPPARHLPPGHYTDALWTATDPRISMAYCDKSRIMFGCAVLDPKARVAETPPTPDADEVAAASSSLAEDLTVRKQPPRSAKPEKQWGRRQHRTTRRPALPKGTTKAVEPVTRLTESVVLVRDEAMICPVLQIHWGPTDPLSQPPKWPGINPNTHAEDHTVQTLAHAYRSATQYPDPNAKALAHRLAHRSLDIERRRLRASKYAA